MFEQFFLDKHDQVTFDLFKMLKARGTEPFTINRLSGVLGLSYQKTLKTYHALENDLRTLQIADDHAERAHAETFYELATGIHVERYRFYLLQHSVCFQFYTELLQNGAISLDAFAHAHGVSSSTLRRKAEPFRSFLFERQLSFDMSNWVLQGSELTIRQLMTSFFNEAYRGGTWPFTIITKSEVAACYKTLQNLPSAFEDPRPQVVTLRRLISLAVQLLRIKQKHYFVPTTQMNQMLAASHQSSPLIFTAEYFPHVPPRALAAERSYYFFMRVSKLDLSRQASHLQQNIYTYFTSFDSPVKRFADQLLAALTQSLDPFRKLRVQSDQSLRTNLYRVIYTYYVINGTFIKASDFSDVSDYQVSGAPLRAQIRNFIHSIPQSAPERVFKRYLPDITNSIFFVLLPDYEDFQPQALLQVRLDLEIQGIITRDMLDFMQGLGLINVLPDNSVAKADVVITSSQNLAKMLRTMNGELVARADQQKIIYWGSENSDDDLYSLLTKLRRLAAAKAAAQSQ
jgi:hypothetical protein